MGPTLLLQIPTRPAPCHRTARPGPELLLLAARGLADGHTLIRAVRRGACVLLDTRRLDRASGQRLLDYCAGGVTAMDGQAHRAGDNAFLFAPALSRVTAPGR
jgi:FtsZ-interacting cell division protein YlmF